MDAHLFRLFWSNAHKLLANARIGKIQEPLPGLLTLDIYKLGQKRQLCWRWGKQKPFCFLHGERLAAARPPAGTVMQIRKYFADRHIASVVTQFCQRKIWLLPSGAVARSAEKNEKLPWLCLDLQNGPELSFLPVESSPEEDLPVWPEPLDLAGQNLDWRKWPVLTPGLRKALEKLPKEEQWALVEDLRMGGGCLFLQKDGNGTIVSASAWPLGGNEETISEEEPEDGSILAGFALAGKALVLDSLYKSEASQFASNSQRKTAKLDKLLKKLGQDELRLNEMLAREADAKAISARLWQIDHQQHESSITVEDGDSTREIKLDPRLSIRQNMERFFHNAKRARRGLAMVAKRRDDTLKKIAELSSAASFLAHEASGASRQQTARADESGAALKALREKLPKNVQGMFSSDGYVLLAGRDARGNNNVRRLASPHDLWAHVESGPGAHVIIRRPHPGHVVPERTLDEAGRLAASKSWLKDSPEASIMYAEVRHVHPDRKGPPGKVLIDKLAMTRLVDARPQHLES